MKVNKISHIAILVKDLEKAKKLYSELFDTDFSAEIISKENDTRGLMSPLGIELVAPLTPDGATSKNLERRGEGFAILALDVADIEQGIKDMESHSVRMLGRGESDIGKAATFHPKDLNGVMIELLERK